MLIPSVSRSYGHWFEPLFIWHDLFLNKKRKYIFRGFWVFSPTTLYYSFQPLPILLYSGFVSPASHIVATFLFQQNNWIRALYKCLLHYLLMCWPWRVVKLLIDDFPSDCKPVAIRSSFFFLKLVNSGGDRCGNT